MTAILDAVTLKPGGMLFVGSLDSDKVQEMSTFTCAHCSRVVICHPQRQRPRHTCKRCMRWTCDLAGCVQDCNPIADDAERARHDRHAQPWLLRHEGDPVDRIYLPDGSSRLVLRKDHNLSLTEMTRGRRS